MGSEFVMPDYYVMTHRGLGSNPEIDRLRFVLGANRLSEGIINGNTVRKT